MATPSSSATSSASPPMSYLQANSIPPTSLTTNSSSSAGMDPAEREERKKAVQKFLARAEISMVTRGLRARLSYASYKATHNIPHIPLRDLEARSQAPSQSSSQLSQAATSRIIGAKRKAGGGGGGNYYNNPATQGGPPAAATPAAAAGSASYAARGVGGRGTMAPPPPFSGTGTTSRTNYYPNAIPPPNRNAQQNQSQSQGQQGQSLYSSILAPPPAKQARTIHNPRDAPVPAPTRPPVTPKSHVRGGGGSWSGTGTGVKGLEGNGGHGGGRPRALSLVEGTRSHDPKGRKEVGTGPPEKKKRAGQKGTNKGKGKQKSTASLGRTDTLPAIDGEADADGDVDMDMKAAATLTSLLLQHHPHPHSHSQRPSMTASTQSLNATSPRSSLSNGSDDAASVQSGFSQFRQSSARIAANTASAPTLSSQQTLPVSHSHTLSADSSSFRSTTNTTPPPVNHSQTTQTSQSSLISDMNVTGTPRAKKAPTDSEAADLMLYLATSPSPARPGTGRGRGEGPGPGVSGLRAKGRVLFAGGSKGDEGSFASSLGGGGHGGDDVSMDTESGLSMNTSFLGGGGLEAALVEPTVVPPTPMKLAPTPAQLLPPPPSPFVPASARSSGNTTPGGHHQRSLSHLSQSHSHSQSQNQSQTPTPSFNLTDFINVSPSPAGLGPVSGGGGGGMPKLGSSLRADVGRRLFEEEQGGRGHSGGELGEEQPQPQQGGLGAGIDML